LQLRNLGLQKISLGEYPSNIMLAVLDATIILEP
jgi:hypothetical protein